MARELYLADTSVLARLSKPPVANAFSSLAVTGSIAVCAPVAFEVGITARGPSHYSDVMRRLADYATMPTTDGDHRRALEIQAVLAQSSRHRALSLVDALVAAIAEGRGLTVLHYDADFELIAGVTGQPHAWVVPRGTAD